MKLLTAGGSLIDVSRRASPVAGLDSPRRLGSVGKVDLVPLGDGTLQTSTFYGIYRSNPWVWAAVNAITWAVSRTPLKLYEITDEKGGRELVRPDISAPGRNSAAQRLAIVLRRPEPRRSRITVLRKQTTDLLVTGNAMLAKEGRGASLEHLWHVPWRKVTVQEGETVPILYYELGGWRKRKQLTPEDVVHIDVGNDPELPIGTSPLSSLKYTVALYNVIQRHLKNFFGNAARPAGNLQLDKATKPEVLAFIREQVAQMYGGPENAGRTMVTTGKWESIMDTADHSQIVELAKLSREEVAAAYGVAPPLMGILDRAIMGNVKELRIHHLRDCIGPWCALIEEELAAQLLADSPTLDRHFLEFDLGEHLRPDFEARAKAWKDFEHTYALNERRKAENLPTIDHPLADAVFLPLNERPVGDDLEDIGDGGDNVIEDREGNRYLLVTTAEARKPAAASTNGNGSH